MIASTPPAPYSLQNLQNLSGDSSYYQQKVSYTDLRNRAIKQAAQALGIQAGLAAESRAIDAQLQRRAGKLDSIFDFNLVMYRNNVLPPVIEQADNSVNLGSGGQQLRIGGVEYNVIRQVRFVSAPPTWRDYLWMTYPEPKLPNEVLLPKNDDEQALWAKSLTSGWQQGIDQAVSIYHLNLKRLTRDFDGMLLYKVLLVQGMVSPFHVTKAVHGITGNGHHMVIDDKTWTITSQPQLQLHSKLWQPVVIKSKSGATK